MRSGSFSGADTTGAASADFGENELNARGKEPDNGKEAYSVEKEPSVNEPRLNEPVRNAVSAKKLLRKMEKLFVVKEPISYSYSCR